jgi:hypothetical protein
MLYTQTVRKNAGKAEVFKAVGEEGRDVPGEICQVTDMASFL